MRWNTCRYLPAILVVLASLDFTGHESALFSQTPQQVVVDVRGPATPFPHFWEQTFGSGRAILSLRESYRKDLRAVKEVTELRYVRFHAILHDEVGVYDEDEAGRPVYNFSYVDQIYDGLLANGVKPFVEISFMPRKLAARQDVHPFWYKQVVAPPKDYAKWDDLMRHFASHLVERYGVDEVATWYFEVWNEPNIDFWSGDPKQPTYFELYDHTARTLKSVSPRLRVGGPATAAADWVDDFLKHCAANHIPVDFVSSHGYADDTVENLFHSKEEIPMDQRVCRAIAKVHRQIEASAFPTLPLMWTEWNVPSFDVLNARDKTYVGAALADDIRQCDGQVAMMSFWTFDDVFEENGVVREPMTGMFGLIAAGGIKKPSFYGFSLLHRLGHQRIANQADNLLVTRREDGTVVVAVWNLADLDQPGSARHMDLQFRGIAADARIQLSRVDATHGNVLPFYEAMGKPVYPTPAQVEQLNRSTQLPPPQNLKLQSGSLSLDLGPNDLVLIEIWK